MYGGGGLAHDGVKVTGNLGPNEPIVEPERYDDHHLPKEFLKDSSMDAFPFLPGIYGHISRFERLSRDD